ncbi:MAG: metal ABC transporter substrate-binding protein [Chitinispirillales bacterium]|jgi:zinc transport system substrate-binding protein|nr:metal ABC transporter substrate-binding protein [Chitinispirillales bacterium]
MKYFTVLALASLLLTLTLFACKQKSQKVSNKETSIVCTVFPQFDWVRQILGDKADKVELTLLLDNKIDLHSYQPSVADIAKISTCDLFIYVGGESDEWVNDALKGAINKNMTVINLLESLGDKAKIEETLEGMEAEKSENGDVEDEEEAEYDEHIWLSLKNAAALLPVIADAISSLDAGNAQVYRDNSAQYVEKLSSLNAQYQAVTEAASVKTVLFGDRFPFRYMTDDYGLTPFAAFTGCSAETEASFETIIFLAKKIDELKLRNVIVTESADQSIAKTVIANTKDKNQRILILNSMQSVTSKDVANGITYLSVMENNLDVLKNALN